MLYGKMGYVVSMKKQRLKWDQILILKWQILQQMV